MHFKALPVTSYEDVTLDLEQAQLHLIADDTTLGGALSGKLPNPALSTASIQKFLQLAVAGNLAINVGTSSLTFPGASPVSNEPTITHGLPRTPIGAAGFYTAGIPDSVVGQIVARNYGATTFTVFARHTTNISAQSQGIWWVAIA